MVWRLERTSATGGRSLGSQAMQLLDRMCGEGSITNCVRNKSG